MCSVPRAFGGGGRGGLSKDVQTHSLVLGTPELAVFSVDTIKSEKLPKLEMAFSSSVSDTVLFLGMPHISRTSMRQKRVSAHQ